jgi:hypothetical protein
MGARDQRVAREMERLDDFSQFARARRNPDDGPIPRIILTNQNARELLEVVTHFDLFPFAFRRSKPSQGYVGIDFARREFAPTKDFDYLTSRYARNSMYVGGRLKRNPLLQGAARVLVSRFEIPAKDLEVCLAVPPTLMAYFNWKAFQSCQDAGLEPKNVSLCMAELVRSGRTWVLRVDQFQLRDGRNVPARRAS